MRIFRECVAFVAIAIIVVTAIVELFSLNIPFVGGEEVKTLTLISALYLLYYIPSVSVSRKSAQQQLSERSDEMSRICREAQAAIENEAMLRDTIARLNEEHEALLQELYTLKTRLKDSPLSDSEAARKAQAAEYRKRDSVMLSLLMHLRDVIEAKEAYRSALLKLSKANNREELHQLLLSSAYESDIAELYRRFDEQFLNIYPHFIDSFNLLLSAEDRLSLTHSGLMTSELRMFALMRLGLTDSKQLAKLLNVTLPTVYNYRSRYKGKFTLSAPLEEIVGSLG